MTKKKIIVEESTVHNLKKVSLEVPKNKLVVFTGVSGSGKSSLLFDTICAEARRQLIDTFSAFARNRLPKISRPSVKEIHNISTSIVIDQKSMGLNLRSTLGTSTELYTFLRLLYARFGSPFAGFSDAYSFNNPEGMCPQCFGLGKEMIIDESKIIDPELSLVDGALLHSDYKKGGYNWKQIVNSGLFDVKIKLKDYSKSDLQNLLHSKRSTFEKQVAGIKSYDYIEGVATRLKRLFANKEEGTDKNRDFFSYQTCSDCNGLRLAEKVRNVKFKGKRIADLVNLELTDLKQFLSEAKDNQNSTIISKMESLLENLIQIGVGYLSLNRPVSTLSGGESQRVKTAKQLGCDLVDLLYVLDEPTAGLHPRDVKNLLPLLTELKDRGNSVLIVEHEPDVIKHADHIINIGPDAGYHGGEVTFEGNYQELIKSNTKLAKSLSENLYKGWKRRSSNDFFSILDADINNLKNVSIKIPKAVLVGITGVAGSGKSSLIFDVFAKENKNAIIVDQSSIGRTSRGTPITYIGLFTSIRKLFSSENNIDASFFSFNSKGACPACNGAGQIKVDMSFLDDVAMVCEKCEGKRFTEKVLTYKLKGKSIHDVLQMTSNQAIDFFEQKDILRKLRIMKEIGLGYLPLGQPLSTLSGGEAQRLKLASELHKKGNLYILDEPTTGLHLHDTEKFLKLVNRLVDQGNSVIIIEHNMELVACCDWIIDMGPEGGKLGGEVIFSGTPEELVKCKESRTAPFISEIISAN